MRFAAVMAFLCCTLFVAGCGDSNNDVVFAPATQPQPASLPNPALLAAQLQSNVDAAMAANDVPGALVGVFTPAGSWTSATGFADIDAQRPIAFSDYSGWRSITKSFTVTVILQLVAQGRLDLDAPVGTYVSGVPNGDIITLRQLAEMRSGLFNYTTAPEFVNELIIDLARPWTDQEILDIAFSHPVNFAPGTEYEYSNTNTVLLGVVAETVTGQTIEQLYRTQIFQPLGLTQTVYLTSTLLPSPFAVGYVFDDEIDSLVEVAINGTALSAAGAMAGTFADLRTWGHALVLGNLLPPELQRQRFLSGPATNGPVYDSYGLGMGEIRGWWGHTGNALGYQAAVFTEPSTGAQIVIMLNAANTNPDVPVDIARDILDTLGWPR